MGWKSIAKAIHPGSRSFLGGTSKDGTAALQQYAKGQAIKGELDREVADYDKIPTMLNDKYTQYARRAGTYGDTPEFQVGLKSEVQAGARGARTAAAARINALKKSLGEAEDFKPEGLGGTQGNVTQETIKNAPVTSNPMVAPGEGDTQATAAPQDQTESASAVTASKKKAKKV